MRLSILQKLVQRNRAKLCRFFTDSDHVSGLFGCPGYEAGIPPGASDRQRIEIIDRGFHRALEDFRPDTVVCDTYWPQYPLARLRSAGIRTILMMRLMNSRIMTARVRTALEAFDAVLIPHHPAEVSWTFGRHRRAVRDLSSLPIGFVGPIARQARTGTAGSNVIFTVGGGGEWPGAGHANRIPTYLNTFYEAAGRLLRRGHPEPALAVGPLLRLDSKYSRRFRLIRTRRLHEHFGPDTVVVSRGGYNTCWEAIGASSRLVLCGSHRSEEDVDARCRFLDHERLGRRVMLSAAQIVDAVERPWSERERLATARWSRQVNAGIPVVLDEVLESRYLRAREP